MASDKDTSGQLNFETSPFDAIRHMDGEREFWQARELSKILGYNRWENFENVIAKAKIACKYNGREVDDHFREVTKLIRAAKGAKRPIRDVELTRYGCYMLVLSSDSSKPIVSHAKDYFAEQTHRKEEAQSPDFESIKQISPYQAEYWSARDLAPLLGYNKWQNFEVAIQRAMIACEQIGQIVTDHFTDVSKMVGLGSNAQREVKDYLLSRFACYLIAQNGDPRKKEIAEAQAYFAVSTRRQELAQLLEEQEERLKLRERVSENNKALAQAASQAGILSQNFGVFQNAGYKGLYGGLGVTDIKERKQVDQHEDLLDRMGRAELAANDFRITQTEERLRKEGTIGQTNAMQVHHEIGKKVRKAIEDIGGTMPEDLAPESSIKPLLDAKNRKLKKLHSQTNEDDTSPKDSLWE